MEVACDLGLEACGPLQQAFHCVTGRTAPQGGRTERAGRAFEAALSPSVTSPDDPSQALEQLPAGFRPVPERARSR